jgi:response regulator RpfG family c-di-GMP phosphodiesterase
MPESVLVVLACGTSRHLVSRTVSEAGYRCETAADEPEALARLAAHAASALLLDLDRPHGDGLRLLCRVREQYPEVAVIAVTALAQPALVREALRLGAADYLLLPMDLRDLGLRLGVVLGRVRRAREDQGYCRRLEQSVTERTRALQETYREVLSVLGAALDTRDPETGCHSQRVIDHTLLVGEMFGIRGEELRDIEYGAALHDVGKIGIPDSVLLKPGSLTDSEWAVMKTHCEIGYRMLRGFDFLRGALPIVLHHHERWNGTGYPAGLRGTEIPLGARLFGVADAYDAMTSDRPYRRALPHATAVAELRKGAGTQFDPDVVDAFLSGIMPVRTAVGPTPPLLAAIP